MNKFSQKPYQLITALLLLVTFQGAVAASTDAITSPISVGSAEVLSVTGSLLAVIMAILLAAFLYSRMKGPRIGGNNVINIIASQALGPKERIVLVEIADTQFAIGMTTSSVQTLHVFDKPIVNREELPEHSGFADRLRDALRGVRK